MRVSSRAMSSGWPWIGLLLWAAAAAAEQPGEPVNEAVFRAERRLYENPPQALASSTTSAVATNERSTPAPTQEPESAASLAARVQSARELAAEQRRSALATRPSSGGISPSQLTIRAAEQNLSTYDLQILRGAGTPAIDSFRRLTIETLADLRRKELFRLWGNGIYHPEAFDVLSDHGRSMAELRRIHFLAKAKGVAALAQRSEQLMQKASSAFERQMQRLSGEVRDNPSFAQLSRELRGADARARQR